MSYRAPLATTTVPGTVIIGSGLEIQSGSIGTGGSAVDDDVVQTVTSADGITQIASMTLTPGAGTYRVFFNANYQIDSVSGDITAAAATDVNELYTTLTSLTTTGVHGSVFGLGEIVTPGVYDVAAAASINGVLTLDGGGDATSIFVFRINGALTSVAASTIVLTNGALSSNVFWLVEGAVALGANTSFVGTAFAHNAAAGAGNGTIISGRLVSNLGAITTDNNVITVPDNPSAVAIGTTLSTFILFTSAGNVTNTPFGTYTGNIGTNSGTISGYDLPTVVVGGIFPPGSIGPGPAKAEFSVYENNTLIARSARLINSAIAVPESIVTLQTTAVIADSQSIDVRAEVIFGALSMFNRDLIIFLA